MIAGKGLDELEKYRLELISRGIAAGKILMKHFLDIIFSHKGPRWERYNIYTSHSIY